MRNQFEYNIKATNGTAKYIKAAKDETMRETLIRESESTEFFVRTNYDT